MRQAAALLALMLLGGCQPVSGQDGPAPAGTFALTLDGTPTAITFIDGDLSGVGDGFRLDIRSLDDITDIRLNAAMDARTGPGRITALQIVTGPQTTLTATDGTTEVRLSPDGSRYVGTLSARVCLTERLCNAAEAVFDFAAPAD